MSDGLLCIGGRTPVAASVSPAILASGFRPFFVLAAAVAATSILLWLLLLKGAFVVDSGFGIIDLHAHEMLFGFTGAVIAGFLLTAIKNWTGQAPASPTMLAALVALFVVGRLAVVVEAATGVHGLSWLEALFLPVFAIVIARPIVGTNNRRNFGVVAIVALFAALDLAMHLAAWTNSPQLGVAARTGALLVPCVLLAVVGGRVIPLFTRNVVASADVVVRAVSIVDGLAIGGAVAAAAVSVAAPVSATVAMVAPAVLMLAGVLTVARMWGWASLATARTPLLWILHVGHFLLGVGFFARGVSLVLPSLITPSAALHILSIGALAVLCLAMMSCVALGHSGRPLVITSATVVSYGCILVAVVARVAASWLPALLDVAGVAFALAFVIFFAGYARILATPRPDGKAG